MGTFSDVAELRIKILGDGAQKDMKTLKMSAEDIKDELLLMENAGLKNSKVYKDMKTLLSDVNMAAKSTLASFDLQNASMTEMRAKKAALNAELNKLVVGSKEWMDKMGEIAPIAEKINQTREQVKNFGKEAEVQQGTWTKYAGLVKAAFVVGVVLEFAKQIWDVGMQVFNLTAKFEKYETVLKNALGSQEKATAALKMLKEIAATTPFSLDEMTASFNKMVNRGLLPTSAEMKKLSDLAASQGKDFDQLTEAVLDAQMGEGERLKEFGIKMKKEGDNVSLSFKGQTTSVKNNEQAIYEAIVAMGEYNGVAGVTSEVSDKLSGKQSNLGDKIDFVTVQLGEKLKPVFHFILDLFVKGVGFVGDFIDKIGPLGILVDSIADTFGGLWNIGKELFFKMFPQAQGQVFDMGKAVKILGTVLYAVLVPFQLLRAAVVGVIDAYRVLGNATSMVGKALQGDFNGAKAEAKQLETSWSNLKKNGTENFGAISKGFNKIWTDSSADMKKTGKDWDSHVNDMKKGQKEMTANTEGEAKKREAAEKKAAKEREATNDKLLDELLKKGKDQAERVKEIEKEYLKWLEEFRKFRNKKINDAIDVIEKNFKNKEIADNKAHEKVIEEGKKGLANRIVKTHKDAVIKQQEANEAYVENYKKGLEYQSQALARWYAGLSNVQKQALDSGIGLIANFLGKQGQQIEDQINKTTDLYEKARLETKRQWIGVGQDALNTFDQMLNGNIVGSVIGVFKTLAGALDNWLMSNAREERARLEQELVLLKKAGEEFIENTKSLFTTEDVSNIKEIYGTLLKMVEVPPVRLDLGEYSTYEGRLQQELAIGASITKNYNTAIEKENDLYDKAKENEELLFNDAIDKINKQYDAAVAGINKKYDWEQQMANRMFDQQSLGIQKQTNAELMALLNNNETKLSLTSEYETNKARIMAAFASQIKPITADMSQAEIDGINRATEARDAQLAKLEGWLTNELAFVINNEGQKRKEYSDTEKIIEEGKNRLNQLAIEQSAADIQRQTDRDIALAAAEAKKKTDTEAAEKVHLDTMEALAKGYNERLTELGKAKDAALAESFKILNEIVKNGYDDMMAKALEAFNAGKITAQQYDEIASRLFTIKDLLGQIDWSNLTPPNFDWNFNIPRFASGTDYVDPNDYWPDGTDTVPAMLNKGERVLTSGQNAAIGNITNEELVRRLTASYISPVGGMFYPVDRALVDSISASGVPTMGGLSASIDNGGFSSWVSTNPTARSGAAASGGMGGFANPSTRANPAMQGRGESGGDVAGALARNNELMQALVNLVANGTNEELKRIADKPNLTLHDVNLAKDKERDARVVSDF